MNVVYLLDALFLLIAGTAAIFVFVLTTSRFRGVFKFVFVLFMALFIFTLVLGYLSQHRYVPVDINQAKTEEPAVSPGQ